MKSAHVLRQVLVRSVVGTIAGGVTGFLAHPIYQGVVLEAARHSGSELGSVTWLLAGAVIGGTVGAVGHVELRGAVRHVVVATVGCIILCVVVGAVLYPEVKERVRVSGLSAADRRRETNNPFAGSLSKYRRDGPLYGMAAGTLLGIGIGVLRWSSDAEPRKALQ